MALDVPDDALLAGNVTRVADFRLDALCHSGGHALAAADYLGHQLIADVGPAQQLDGRAADFAQLGTHGCGGTQVCQLDGGCLQPLQLGLLDFTVPAEQRPPRIVHQPELPANRGQALVGVILTQAQAVFAAAGHHAVGVHHTLGYKVIDQRAKVAGMPRQHQLFPAQGVAGGVQARQQTLRGGLLIAGGSVELSRAVDASHNLAFQRGLEGGGVNAVIFNRIRRAHNFKMLKALDGAVHLVLHRLRQAGRKSLQIHFLGVLAAGLHKDRVALLFFEAHHLILNRGAVPRPDALNIAAIQG